MTTATPSAPATALDHLLQAIPEPSAFRRDGSDGLDLPGILALLGLDLAAKNRLQAVLAVSRFLEGLDTLEVVDITVDEESVDTDEDHFHITWNGNLQDPALTLDGTLTDENELLSLWARRSLSANRAAVNGVEISGGLRLEAEVDADLDLLHLTFTFEATEETPLVSIQGSMPALSLMQRILA